MNSQQLARVGFKQWHTSSLTSEISLLSSLPSNKVGIYIVRFAAPQALRLGQSDLAYIGKATNSGGLKQRVRQYYHPGHRNATSLRLQANIQSHQVELAHICLTTADRSAVVEAALLHGFREQHGQLPPWNCRLPRHKGALRLWAQLGLILAAVKEAPPSTST